MGKLDMLYRYITAPVATLSRDDERINHVWPLAVVLVAAGSIIDIITFELSTSIIAVVFGSVGIMFSLLMLAIIWDFSAQLAGAKGQSLHLFKWLTLSLLPYTLNVPLQLIESTSSGVLPMLAKLGFLAISILVIYLQIKTIQTLYNVPLSRSVIIYFSPILALIGGGIIIGLVVLLIAGTLG